MEYVALIIDDDTWMQRILSKVLEGFGFTTITVSNGFDGIAMAVEQRPVIVFLDIMMQELSGHQVLKILKKIKTTKDVPIVMISAISDTENLRIAIKNGASGFISKPFTKATIQEKLRTVLGVEQFGRIVAKQPPQISVNIHSDNIPSTEAHAISTILTNTHDYSSDSYLPNNDAHESIHPNPLVDKVYPSNESTKHSNAIRDLLLGNPKS